MDSERPTENFDESKLKEILRNFDKRHNENEKLRVKYCDEPAKFASSETELFAILDELQSITTSPHLYEFFFNRPSFKSLINLLIHDNKDISAKVLCIIQELTDTEDIEDKDVVDKIKVALDSSGLIRLIVSNIERFDESTKEEAQAINESLSIIENMIDIDKNVASLKEMQDLIQWMLSKIDYQAYSPIKLAIAELLNVLIVNDETHKDTLGKHGGVDILLRQIAIYRTNAPETGDEHEYMEQAILCMGTCMFNHNENKNLFLDDEGIELVELILREKSDVVKLSNIKCSIVNMLNYLLTTTEEQDKIVTQCCERLVQIMGLRVIFPIFSNPKIIISKKVKRAEYDGVVANVEENISSILLSLVKYCENSDLIQRILVKFSESNFDKFNHLLGLHSKYFKKLAAMQAEDDGEEEDDQDSGVENSREYFTLRAIDQIIIRLCFLNKHFEIYDPTSGKTFDSYIKHTITKRPELRHQIKLQVGQLLQQLPEQDESERKTISLLLDYFEDHICAPKPS